MRWLERAVELAAANAASGAGGPFGAVIVRDGAIIAEGANSVVRTADPTAHAEVVAIRNAASARGSHELTGCTLFASCEPCPMCLGAILWARIDRVYFAATKSDAAAAGFDDSLFYEQFGKPAGERIVPMLQQSVADRVRPFREWQSFSGKVTY
ncbi:MAG: nucleoside deaminase [Acidobacteria bacterium]|nr:nucleoside deaminase [Acidobacteriota bacterium]